MKKRDVLVFLTMCLYLCMLPLYIEAKLSSNQIGNREQEFKRIAIPNLKAFNFACKDEINMEITPYVETRKWVYLNVNCI